MEPWLSLALESLLKDLLPASQYISNVEDERRYR